MNYIWAIVSPENEIEVDSKASGRAEAWKKFCYPALRKSAFKKDGWKAKRFTKSKFEKLTTAIKTERQNMNASEAQLESVVISPLKTRFHKVKFNLNWGSPEISGTALEFRFEHGNSIGVENITEADARGLYEDLKKRFARRRKVKT